MSKGKVFEALADPTRRRVLQLLKSGSMTAGELGSHFDLAASTLSRHFAVLDDAGLITRIRNGTSIVHHLNVSVLEDALLALLDSVRAGGTS